MSSAPKTIHLLGICGTGMGSFAGLLKAAGHVVRGSDQNVYPPMSDKLRELGVEVRSPYRAENIEPLPDLFIVGNVIRRDNPEAVAAMASGVPALSFPAALKELFLAGRHSVVVAGTHGKTTTTSLTAWVLESAGRAPSFLVGGVPENFGEGARLGRGRYFVVEGDEYDTAYFDKGPKFLHYSPRSLIVTSIEFDHADIYPNVEAIERRFDELVALLPADGHLIVSASESRPLARAARSPARVTTYSARPGVAADATAEVTGVEAGGTRFRVTLRGATFGEFLLPMFGLHNVENALAVVAFSAGEGLSVAEIAQGLASFRGVLRRQTVVAEVGGVRVLDDFAHHPTAVRETLRAVRARFPSGRLFAIFEPRSATSARGHFQAAYAEAFDDADVVIIAGVGRPEIKAEERLDVARLAADLNARGRPASAIPDVDEIVRTLAAEARSGDTLLFMSNGGFGGITRKMPDALRAR